MPLPLLIICYLILAILLVYISIKLADYCDHLSKYSKLSGAFIGGIMLAAATSLPELFTSITSIFVTRETNYIIGNVLGSNIFNVTIFAVVILLFFNKLHQSKIAKFHYSYIIFTAIAYLLCLLALIAETVFRITFLQLGFINIVSLLIIFNYVISIILLPSNDEEEEDTVNKTSNKLVFIKFAIAATLLVVVSILITMATDALNRELHLSAVTAGVIFLSIVTSLPELVSSLRLGYKGNFDASLSNITGSCLFNFIIFSLSDLLTFTTAPLYVSSQDTLNLIFFGLAELVIVVIFLLLKHFTKLPKKVSIIINILLALSIISCYFSYYIFAF